jgi:hypothetical protein
MELKKMNSFDLLCRDIKNEIIEYLEKSEILFITSIEKKYIFTI